MFIYRTCEPSARPATGTHAFDRVGDLAILVGRSTGHPHSFDSERSGNASTGPGGTGRDEQLGPGPGLGPNLQRDGVDGRRRDTTEGLVVDAEDVVAPEVLDREFTVGRERRERKSLAASDLVTRGPGELRVRRSTHLHSQLSQRERRVQRVL